MSQATQQPWTIKRLLEWTVEHFKSANSPGSRLDAEILLAESLECPRISLYTRFDEVPDEPSVAKFREWVKRRAAGEPVAYLVGHKEFYSLKFLVNGHVLIPRPETEHVVMAALEAAKQIPDRPMRLVDVGTGSGCVAITLAKQLLETAKIDEIAIAATDVSNDALEVARGNAAAHEVQSRVRFFAGDLLEALPTGSKPVNMIVSNPPYIGTGEINTVDESVKDHEPHVALFGGHDGTEIIQRLVKQAIPMLLPGGFLIFETSPVNIDRCVDLVAANSEFESVNVDKDYSGHKRVVVARTKA
jgi:release factor glutamine methyltransferase